MLDKVNLTRGRRSAKYASLPPGALAAMGVVAVLLAAVLSGPLQAQRPRRGPWLAEPWMDEGPSSSVGLAVGEKIPSFRAPDQSGRMQDFSSLRGPKGALILFNRSADW